MGEISALSSSEPTEPQKHDHTPPKAVVLGILACSYSGCWLSRLPYNCHFFCHPRGGEALLAPEKFGGKPYPLGIVSKFLEAHQ